MACHVIPKVHRIVHLSSVHFPYDPRIVFRMATSTAAHYDTLLILPRADATVARNIRFIALPFFKSLWLRLFLCHPIALWHCLHLRPSLLHIHDPELIPLALLMRLMGTKVVYDIHENVYKQTTAKQFNNNAVFRRFFRYFDRLAQQYFWLILAENAYLPYYQHSKQNPVVILNYPTLPFFEAIPQQITQRTTLLYVGQLSMARGIDTLVGALVLLRKKGIDLPVKLFGDFEFDLHNATQLQQIAGFSKVADLLTFYGKTDARQAFSHAGQAIAGLALLKPIGDFADSYPTKLFEYMAMGLPVITSSFVLYRAVVETHQCGFCIDPQSTSQLADALEWLIAHPQEAQQMGKNGKKAVQYTYNWQSQEAKLMALYDQILGKRR